MSAVWQVQEAKNRFSELIDKALAEGPQVVTRHGRPVVKVVAASKAPEPSAAEDGLAEALLPAPRIDGLDASPRRSRKTALDLDDPEASANNDQVTLPKAIREHLRIEPGQEVDYEPLADGSVRMFAVARKPVPDNPFAKWRGTGILKMSTEEIMRITRGDDWGR
ncbi:MAG: type II toxin-antitoxin system prevent-host-death family antitoxin [Burkholderiales bacterium]